MTWDGVVRLRSADTSGSSGPRLRRLADWASRLGGEVAGDGAVVPLRIVPVHRAGEGDLAPLLASRFVAAASEAARRGASLLVDRTLARAIEGAGAPRWVHDHATWALAALLEEADVPDVEARVGARCSIAPSAVLGPRVVVGDGVRIGAGTVVGHPGFGWAFGPGGAVRPVPQLGGVVIEDDVSIGPLCTVDAGTLAPTRVRRGAKLDAQVHVGHNVDIGEGVIVAAQSGFAGSVVVGKGALVGGQVGIADHVVVGEGARIAAKSGVIGDVPAGAVMAGYPAVPRARWLRALATMYRGLRPSARAGDRGRLR